MPFQKIKLKLVAIVAFIIVFEFTKLIYDRVIVFNESNLYTQFIRIILTGLLFYAIYKGYDWASKALSVVMIVAIIMLAFVLFRTTSNFMMISSILKIIVYTFTVYFLNINKEFQDFMLHQRIKNSKRDS